MTPAPDDVSEPTRAEQLRDRIDPESVALLEITASSSETLLSRVMAYEAVHTISDRADLGRRVEPSDRRIYALVHPELPEEPLVFVEVALTVRVPDAIADILSADREPIAATAADTAVFYSINNGHSALRGLSLGHLLISRTAAVLARELPNLHTFVTLSPAPGFGAWLRDRAQAGDTHATELVALISTPDWLNGRTSRARHAELTVQLAREYLATTRTDGRTLDPVARFHFGNGATLERINPQGNLSPDGIEQSAGMMVNYRYAPTATAD